MHGAKRHFRRGRRGFTLLELSVTVVIVILLLGAVSVIFSGASRAVGTSQALMEVMAQERAVGQMLRRDVAGMNKEGFLVIRSRMLDPTKPEGMRFDQVAFLAYGSFADRTGADDPVAPFAESTVASAAHIWWGQLVMERQEPPDPSYLVPNQSVPLKRDRLPTGVYLVPEGEPDAVPVVKEPEFVLGRHETLLLPGPPDEGHRVAAGGRVLMAYSQIGYLGSMGGNTGETIKGAGEWEPAHITSSRFAVAGVLPADVLPGAGIQYCYRFKALCSPYDTEVTTNPFVNGTMRMHPIVLKGVSSFKIDWTDGTVDATTHQLQWYGPQLFKGDAGVESAFHHGNTDGDHYVAVFGKSSAGGAGRWPTALRFSFHVVVDRLAGGRDFVECVSLPE